MLLVICETDCDLQSGSVDCKFGKKIAFGFRLSNYKLENMFSAFCAIMVNKCVVVVYGCKSGYLSSASAEKKVSFFTFPFEKPDLGTNAKFSPRQQQVQNFPQKTMVAGSNFSWQGIKRKAVYTGGAGPVCKCTEQCTGWGIETWGCNISPLGSSAKISPCGEIFALDPRFVTKPN